MGRGSQTRGLAHLDVFGLEQPRTIEEKSVVPRVSVDEDVMVAGVMIRAG